MEPCGPLPTAAAGEGGRPRGLRLGDRFGGLHFYFPSPLFDVSKTVTLVKFDFFCSEVAECGSRKVLIGPHWT
ncbi:hypothetical protein Cadr_000020095 [Camelus dromedarius]|uniref:Uncharacterized protein n=1 Tax=Camelus dromedarius TaxID=9838 RepID=A0A5N4D0A8_CAMDR|nr:hypothetical protein Cadr_000020095 [Camelus dromedarius]